MTELIGAALFAVSALSFWYLMPKNGKTHWLVDVPSIAAYLPAFIISGLALGLVMMLAAVI